MRQFRSLPTSNLSDNAERETSIKDFGGVDYSHSCLFVDTARATDMSNFIKDNNISQKRKGWREIFQFPFSVVEGDPIYNQINGIWELDITSYKADSHSYQIDNYVIVHADKKFYYMTKTNISTNEETAGISNNANQTNSIYELKANEIKFPTGLDFSSLITNEKSFGIVADERLYVFAGCYFMIGIFNGEMQIRRVEDDENTYVPSTTITIPPFEYNAMLKDTDNVLSSNSFDNVNMMTRYRINKLQGLSYLAMLGHFADRFANENQVNAVKDSSGYGYYYEDSTGKSVKIDVESYITSLNIDSLDKAIVYTYPLDCIPYEYNSTYDEDEQGIIDALNKSVVSVKGKIYIPSYPNGLEVTSATRVDDVSGFYNFNDIKGTYKKRNELLYYYDYEITEWRDNIPYGTCNIVFNYNVVPDNTDIHSISVKLSRYVGLADRINKCKFGIMYGLNNNNNRLFVSGNPTYPNIDYHTVASSTLSDDGVNALSANNSLTYFSDLSYSTLGGKVNTINGYAILGDGTMAILKTLSGVEPTIYFRKATSISENVTDINGNSYTKITEQYPITVGAIGEGALGFDSIENLNGDILMWSGNGVYGIELDSNVASSQRFAKRRSRLVDTVFTNYTDSELQNAATTVFNDKYFLCINSTCYIADARFPIKLEDDLDGEFQYEWWKWDNVPARLFFHYNNQLWFCTSTGMLCCFENTNYIDTTYLELTSSDICHVDGDGELVNRFVINEAYISSLEEMSDNDNVQIERDLYALGLDTSMACSVEGNTLIYDLSQDTRVEDKDYMRKFLFSIPNYKICFDNINSNTVGNIMTNKVYIINNVTVIDDVFRFEFEDEEIIFGTLGFRLCLKIDTLNNEQVNLLSICDVACKIEDNYYLIKNFSSDNGKYFFLDNEGNVDIELDTKPKFQYFSLRDYTEEGRALTIIQYDGVAPVADLGRFIFNRIVSCYYITPPFDMGTKMYNKDLRQLIIVPDTLLGTSVDFGFETKNSTKEFNAYTGRALNFNEIDFDYISFLSETFATVYCKTARVKRWSYIRFFFKSDTDNNCKINNLTIVYKIGTRNKGVR